MSLPATILYPEAFNRSKAAGFDGVWDWEILRGCFPRGIMPMDIDGSIEICGRFLQFETKNPGQEVPKGQLLALTRQPASIYTVIFIWGKSQPVEWQIWHNGVMGERRPCSVEKLRFACMRWVKWAERTGR